MAMKPSEMTNDGLADYIVNVIGGGIFKEYYAEAAARLRLKQQSDNYESEYKREICDLRRLLKVAEDALVESKVAVCHTGNSKGYCGYEGAKFDPCRVYKDIDKALASIREEGGMK